MLFQLKFHQTPKKYDKITEVNAEESALRLGVKNKLQKMFRKKRPCNQQEEVTTTGYVQMSKIIDTDLKQKSQKNPSRIHPEQLATTRLLCQEYLQSSQEMKRLMQPAKDSSVELQRAIECILLSNFPSTTSSRKAKRKGREGIPGGQQRHPAFQSSLYTGKTKFAKRKLEIKGIQRRISFDKYIPTLDTIVEFEELWKGRQITAL